jgi:hypothetical protein
MKICRILEADLTSAAGKFKIEDSPSKLVFVHEPTTITFCTQLELGKFIINFAVLTIRCQVRRRLETKLFTGAPKFKVGKPRGGEEKRTKAELIKLSG